MLLLRRLMSKSSGRSRVAGSSVGPSGDVRMLEDLLLENLRSNAGSKASAAAEGEAYENEKGKKKGKRGEGSRR